jgi:NAD(P)H-dependent flavin oxidoreductase YrpB (nitropropane dioxygenase family)
MLYTRICDILGGDHPILGAPMSGGIAAVRGGNAVGLIHEIEAAGEIVRQVVAEAEHLLREHPGQVLHS